MCVWELDVCEAEHMLVATTAWWGEGFTFLCLIDFPFHQVGPTGRSAYGF